MNELFLNSTNILNCNIVDVVGDITDGAMTYGDKDNKYKVTRIEILNGGVINLYGIKLLNQKPLTKEDIGEIADKVIDIFCDNMRKGYRISESN